MNEKFRKGLVFASLGFALIYGAANLIPSKEDRSKQLSLSEVTQLEANRITPEAGSLINADSMASLSWGSDPFRGRQKESSVKTNGRKSGIGWHLSGILYSGNNPAAIINKKMVRIGDVVDKAKVIKIERKQVTLEYKGRRQTLSVS